MKKLMVLLLLVAALMACDQTEVPAPATAVSLPATTVPAEPNTNENSAAVVPATAVPEEAPVSEATPNTRPYAGTVPAPDFPPGLDWLNVARPLTMTDLRGKIVLLDFWTYGCINCMHVIPELKRLEEKFGDELGAFGQICQRK